MRLCQEYRQIKNTKIVLLGISAIIRSYSKLKYQQFRSNTEAANINDFGCSDIRCEMIVGYARVSSVRRSVVPRLIASTSPRPWLR